MTAPASTSRAYLLVMLAAACLAGSGRSQLPDGPRRPFMREFQEYRELRELREMRERYVQRAIDASRVLADQYVKALAALELQAVESDDYETALAAQQRRMEIAVHYAKRDADASGTIVLKPGEAKLAGATYLMKSESTLVFLRTSVCSAAWDLLKIAPGTYTVSLVCGVGDINEEPFEGRNNNEVEFGEVSSLIGTNTSKLTLNLEPTGGWNEYKNFTFGDIKITRNTARFVVKSTTSHGSGGLMRLKEIRLTPALPVLNPQDTEAIHASLAELEELRQAHQMRLRELEQIALNTHLLKLNKLSDELIAKQDEEGAAAVVAETKRAHESFGKLEKAARSPAGGAFTEGLEVIRDAVFVEAPSNSGDRFLVSAGGERYSVKLMSVSCPSPNPEDHEGKDFHERYFGITKADSILIGRQAKEFTAAYLKDRPLKLFTRWQKDEMGSVLVDVQPAEIGDFGGILVDNGLAAVLQPTSRNPAQRKAEASVRDILRQREAEARAKPVPPGAWAFVSDAKPTR